MGGGTQLIIDNETNKPYIEIIDNKIISNDGIEEWDISNDIPNTDPEVVGEVYTWGRATDGRLGFGYTTTYAQFTPVKLYNTAWRKMAVFDHTLAIDENNDLWGWGYNSGAQLGLGHTNTTQYTAVKLAPTTKWKNIACGEFTSFMQDVNGDWYGCGCNKQGQLGMNKETPFFQPNIIKLNHQTKWKQMYSAHNATFAITDSGEAYAWGINDSTSDMGNGHIAPYKIKNQIYKKIVASKDYASRGITYFMVTEQGELWGWGLNNSGTLGFSYAGTYRTPVNMFYGTKWRDIQVDTYVAYAQAEDGQWYQWGSNIYGQLGLGYTSDIQYTPIKLKLPFESIECSRYNTFALSVDGYWYVWGQNGYGDLGLGHNRTSYTPKKQNLTKWKKVFMGAEQTYGII